MSVVVVGVTPHQGERESRSQGEGTQVSRINRIDEVCAMQRADTLLMIIHDRGKRDLPLAVCRRERSYGVRDRGTAVEVGCPARSHV